MTLVHAATFAKSLDRLSTAEQKQVKITSLDLMLDPTGNGLQMHRIDAAPGFWSARVNQDIRLILHKDGERTLLAYVDHHEEAYRWAERRKLVPHERTGALQFVERIDAPAEQLVYTEPAHGDPAPVADERPFAHLSDDQLLDVGVPRDWLGVVRAAEMASVDGLFASLPEEAAEALYDVATGGSIETHIAAQATPGADPIAHPDAQRRFRVVDNLEELRAALDQPFERWTVFLHPVQRALAVRDWKGPARVSGSAGTGKTIVALHRAAHLAGQHAEARVLLTTFSKPLATALARKRDILTEADPTIRERITVRALDQAAIELHAAVFGQPNRATPAQVRAAINDARKVGLGGTHTAAFLFEEWTELVDAWNVTDAEAYATLPRLGRQTRLGVHQREAAWSVFAFVRQRLSDRGVVTWPAIYGRITDWLKNGGALPFTHVVVDEAQDLSVAQVRFLAEIARQRPDALFLAGDIGQRIFHLPFSWARLGLDIRGRSHSLKVNYRTSHQIRAAADRLLPSAITDLDGIEEGRRGTVSIFDGPAPEIVLAKDADDEIRQVAAFLRACRDEGLMAREIGVLVRSEGQLGRARKAVAAAGFDPRATDGVTIAIMHDAKGLEFRAVAVMACDDGVLPDPARLAAVGINGELEPVYETERHLLYVACTRARDRLIVSGVAPGSEFLDDLA